MTRGDTAPTTARIFVTVGTDHHPFDRLVAWLDGWIRSRRDQDFECSVQHGDTAPPKEAGGAEFLPHGEMARRMREATAVVCHGGPGTIYDALAAGTIPIVVPRRRDLGEHVDDHQVLFAARLERAGHIYVARSEQDFAELLDATLTDRARFVAPSVGDRVAESATRFEHLIGTRFAIWPSSEPIGRPTERS